MTELTKKMISDKAKELYMTQWIIPPNEFDELSHDNKHQWICTAKHVIASELRGKIEGLEIGNGYKDAYVERQISLLTEQLKETEGTL